MAKSTRKRDALPKRHASPAVVPLRGEKVGEQLDEVKYCSKACRTQRPGDLEERLEQAIIELINVRTHATICPSEAARSVAPERGNLSWRRHAKRHDAWPIVEWSRLPNEANASNPQDFEDPFA